MVVDTELRTLRIDVDTHFLPTLSPELLREALADKATEWGAHKLDAVVRDAVVFADPNAKSGHGFQATESGQRLLGGGSGQRGPVGHGDPSARLDVLAEAGFDMQVLIPDGIFRHPFHSPISREWEPGLQLALCRGYNQMAAAVQRQWPGTFIGTGIVPLDDVQEACDEARRLEALGLRSITVNGNWKGRNWDEIEFLPFWQTLEELSLVLFVHHNPFSCKVSDHEPTSYTVGWDRMRRMHISNYVGCGFEYMLGMASLTLGGVLQQFPDLKFVFFEAGGSWLPWIMYELDRAYQVQPQCARCDIEPSELILSSCLVAVEPDETPIVHAINAIGSENFVIGSDYPHPPSTHPNTIAGVMALGLSEEDQDNVLGGNVQRLFGLR